MKMNVAIIIPTFFEEENIYKLIKTINKLKFKKKIFVIDDTFKPLNISIETDEYDDSEYPKSWVL